MIVNRYWAGIFAAALGFGIWLSEPLLALAGLFGLMIGGAELLWTKYCLSGVEYERTLGGTHALWGQDVQLTIRLANRKLLPLTWLQTEDRVPEQLTIDKARLVRGALGSLVVYLRNLLPMLPYEQVVRRYTIRCRHRGLFEFGPGRLESGDLLGYTSRSMTYPKTDRLLIYPKLFELDVPTPQSRRIVGRQKSDRLILTDPSRTVGVRAYQPGDPLRHVDWRSSARSRDVLVRVFEPTTDLALAIFLNFRVPGFGHGNYDPPELEFGISLAASLAKWALDRGYPAGMFGNGARGGMGGVRQPVSGDPGQLRRILEVLALATPFGLTSIAQVLASESARVPFESSIVLITATFDQALLAALDEARRRRPVTVWYIKTATAPELRLPHLNIVTVPYVEHWQELERLHLAA